jgi:hypothetical protein
MYLHRLEYSNWANNMVKIQGRDAIDRWSTDYKQGNRSKVKAIRNLDKGDQFLGICTMKSIKNTLFLILILILSSACVQESFKMDQNTMQEMAIILPEEPGSIGLFAADELNRHLKMIYGNPLTVRELSESENGNFKYNIFIGIPPVEFDRSLAAEEAVYVVKGNDLYIFGDDLIQVKTGNSVPGRYEDEILDEVLQMAFNRTGTLFALYEFLENELGVKWLKPGDNGIFYTPDISVTLTDKLVSWKPDLFQRNIRAGYFWPGRSKFAPEDFTLSPELSRQKAADENIWLRRMRFGRSKHMQFGHAFTSYWERYKDSDPGIFALNAKRERAPLGREERVKMCPSSPGLVNIVVDNWLTSREVAPHSHSYSISGCENDTDGFGDAEWCHCENCRALDAHKNGESLNDHLTDRYTYFWNNLVTEARKHQDDIMVSCYAYQETLLPPRNIRLNPGIVVEFIPRMAGDFEKTQALYDGWREKGMEMMLFRPNDLNWHFGMAMGQEERVYRHFQLALKNGALGTDFDSMYGYWEGVSDLPYYILARAHIDPDATFEELEKEFLSVFGPAEKDLRAYYAHWRAIFNDKMIPADLALSDGIEPAYFEWYDMGKLTQRIDDFYAEEDFDVTDGYLESALKKDVTPLAEDYIQRIQISNRHSRLTFISLMAGISGDEQEITKRAGELLRFRIENRDNIDMNWGMLFWAQYYHLYDQIGTRFLGILSDDINMKDY